MAIDMGELSLERVFGMFIAVVYVGDLNHPYLYLLQDPDIHGDRGGMFAIRDHELLARILLTCHPKEMIEVVARSSCGLDDEECEVLACRGNVSYRFPGNWEVRIIGERIVVWPPRESWEELVAVCIPPHFSRETWTQVVEDSVGRAQVKSGPFSAQKQFAWARSLEVSRLFLQTGGEFCSLD